MVTIQKETCFTTNLSNVLKQNDYEKILHNIHAENIGFEPMVQLPVHLISSQAQSTTLAIFPLFSILLVAHRGFEPLILRMRISRPGPARRMRRSLFSVCKDR